MSERERETSSEAEGAAPHPPWVRTLLRVDRGVGLLEQIMLAVFLAVLIGIGAYQAVGRNFFNKSPVWSFDVLRYSVFFIAMTGAALSAHTKQVIRMDVLTRALSPRGRAISRLATAVFTIVVCLFFAYAGWRLRGALLDEKESAIIHPSVGVLAIPIGSLLIAFHMTVQSIVMATTLARGEIPVEEEQAVH